MNLSQKMVTKCDGIITNCDSLAYYKVRWTVITNCDSLFITKCDTVYCKIATGITKCDGFFTNCERYYKVRWLLQIATVQTFSSVRSFIISEISSFVLLIGRTIVFHGEILSFVLLIGYEQNQYEFHLSTYEINAFLVFS